MGYVFRLLDPWVPARRIPLGISPANGSTRCVGCDKSVQRARPELFVQASLGARWHWERRVVENKPNLRSLGAVRVEILVPVWSECEIDWYLDEHVNFSKIIWVAKGTWLVVRHLRLDFGEETFGERGGESLKCIQVQNWALSCCSYTYLASPRAVSAKSAVVSCPNEISELVDFVKLDGVVEWVLSRVFSQCTYTSIILLTMVDPSNAPIPLGSPYPNAPTIKRSSSYLCE